VTGFSSIEFSIFGKWIETLKRIVPGISHVGMIYNPDNPHAAAYLPSFETGARQFAVQPVTLPIHGLADVGDVVRLGFWTTGLLTASGLKALGRTGRGAVGMNPDSAKLSLHDSSHLTAVVPAGKLGPEITNFRITSHTTRDCSWHVR
jgi:hypothetical protein